METGKWHLHSCIGNRSKRSANERIGIRKVEVERPADQSPDLNILIDCKQTAEILCRKETRSKSASSSFGQQVSRSLIHFNGKFACPSGLFAIPTQRMTINLLLYDAAYKSVYEPFGTEDAIVYYPCRCCSRNIDYCLISLSAARFAYFSSTSF